ncbi:MAG TPA: TauD/TfdA family dioxygenase [Acidimicrobiales bacterium]|nr:TauD/TfdA family dioxygenase [Acidimicrobiales bacterium]
MPPSASAIEVRPLSPAVGAAVTGVDLHDELDDATFEILWSALLDRGMLVFPSQHIAAAELDAFGRRWGEPLVVPYLAPHAVDGYPAILRVTNMGKQGTLTENWHFDSAFFEQPPPLAILAAQRLPDVGGDTMWANQYLAFEALSERMQELLGGLRAAFTGTRVDDDGQRRDVVTYHPVVRTHPHTKRRALAIGRIESVPHFEGMTEAESRPLLQFLYQHASRPEFVYRHRWGQGDVVMWDNRCTLHYAIHDYGDEPRDLIRMTVLGEQCS